MFMLGSLQPISMQCVRQRKAVVNLFSKAFVGHWIFPQSSTNFLFANRICCVNPTRQQDDFQKSSNNFWSTNEHFVGDYCFNSKRLLSSTLSKGQKHVHASHQWNVDFTNFQEAYRSKTLFEIVRATVVFWLCNFNFLVENGIKVRVELSLCIFLNQLLSSISYFIIYSFKFFWENIATALNVTM